MLLLHLACSEEDLKFKAEIPPFPEAPNHKSQITNHNAHQYISSILIGRSQRRPSLGPQTLPFHIPAKMLFHGSSGGVRPGLECQVWRRPSVVS